MSKNVNALMLFTITATQQLHETNITPWQAKQWGKSGRGMGSKYSKEFSPKTKPGKYSGRVPKRKKKSR